MTTSTTGWVITQRLTPTEVDHRTLIAARAAVEKSLRAGQLLLCPLSGRPLKVYARSITPAMARVLAVIYHLTAGKRAWVTPTQIGERGGDYGKLKHWGLIEAKCINEERKARWRITPRGIDFVDQGLEVQKQLLIYNDRCVGHVAGKVVTFADLCGGLNLAEVLKAKGLP